LFSDTKQQDVYSLSAQILLGNLGSRMLETYEMRDHALLVP
jgi:hypothetical protein